MLSNSLPRGATFLSNLDRLTGEQLQKLFTEEWFNRIFPGASRLRGCTQGTQEHLEGDVAVHTALVFDTMVRTAPQLLNREARNTELLAVILHDLKKPDCREEYSPGNVSFPNHEELAAAEVFHAAKKLNLSPQETDEIHFLVKYHGHAHGWPTLSEELRLEISSSQWKAGLALLQEADAKSCLLPGQGHLPVYSKEILEA